MTVPSTPPKASRWRSHEECLRRFLSLFGARDRVLVTIDPDPDSIGSALAVKRLLWRHAQSVTIGFARPCRRLNNLTLLRLLKIPHEVATPETIARHDKFVLVDSQPHHRDLFSQISYTAVIDHHPLGGPVEAPFVDVRPQYGATSSMLTEYLRAAGVAPSRTLATALLYGIKTDTSDFERQSIKEDVNAFQYLYERANISVIRKVEISDITRRDLKYFKIAISRHRVVRKRIFAHLDEVSSCDILVIVADFFMRVHDTAWSVVSGLCDHTLTIVVRNDGYRKNAGKAVAKAFSDIGGAGGHKSMARAEIPIENLAAVLPDMSSPAVERFVIRRFTHSTT